MRRLRVEQNVLVRPLLDYLILLFLFEFHFLFPMHILLIVIDSDPSHSKIEFQPARLPSYTDYLRILRFVISILTSSLGLSYEFPKCKPIPN